jgi:hypothetical protein
MAGIESERWEAPMYEATGPLERPLKAHELRALIGEKALMEGAPALMDEETEDDSMRFIAGQEVEDPESDVEIIPSSVL